MTSVLTVPKYLGQEKREIGGKCPPKPTHTHNLCTSSLCHLGLKPPEVWGDHFQWTLPKQNIGLASMDYGAFVGYVCLKSHIASAWRKKKNKIAVQSCCKSQVPLMLVGNWGLQNEVTSLLLGDPNNGRSLLFFYFSFSFFAKAAEISIRSIIVRHGYLLPQSSSRGPSIMHPYKKRAEGVHYGGQMNLYIHKSKWLVEVVKN